MAIYLVSLPRLARLREGRVSREAARPNPAGRQPSAEHEGAAEKATENPIDVSAVALPPSPGGSPGLERSLEDLLRLPKSQIKALLSECGESGSRALLALICRLASIESHLADLSAHVRGMAVLSPPPMGAHTDCEDVPDASKSELLEQVFRKNLLLRRMEDTREPPSE